MLTFDLIKDTEQLIRPYIYKTPLDLSLTLTHHNTEFYFKNEGYQHTKSFKIRGAFSRLLRLSEKEKNKGVVAISSGNHGIAVSYAAQLLGIRNVLVFVPKNTPDTKTTIIAHYGASLIKAGDHYDDAYRIGMDYVKEHDLVYIDGWDKDDLVYAGQGTIGLEIVSEMPNVDTILVPIGGGGLITGIATSVKALNPNIRIIGIQTQACPAMKASIDDQQHHHEYPSAPSVCEALIGGIGLLAFNQSHLIDDLLIVKEETIIKALRHMILKERRIIEASSAVVIAALWDYPQYDFGKKSVLLLSGNNIDIDLLKKMI